MLNRILIILIEGVEPLQKRGNKSARHIAADTGLDGARSTGRAQYAKHKTLSHAKG